MYKNVFQGRAHMLTWLKWGIGAIVGIVALIYTVLIGFLWWGERHDKPPELRADPVYVRSQQPHSMQLLNDGLVSLRHRIDLIESAQQSIELEFFIYELDTAARIITTKLIDAAGRGVKVRLLVDFSAPVFKLGPRYAEALQAKGIEVRYYNTASLFRFVSIQHRSHRKLLIADGKRAITGGRNIGDDYFNLSTHYNFLDSDVLIEGPVVASMRSSFDYYWNAPLAEHSGRVETEANDSFNEKLFVADDELQIIVDRVKEATNQNAAEVRKHTCNDIAFVTDYSGMSAYNRQVFKRLVEFLGEAKSELIGESPYFVLRADGLELLQQMSARGVRQTYLTNSLSSTDAWYTSSAMTFSFSGLRAANIDIRLFEGRRQENSLLLPNLGSERWGVHAKRAVIDRKHVVIGTYNVDPRSANFNSELMLICRNNEELAIEMLSDIESRISGSRTLFEGNASALSSLIQNAELGQKLRFLLAMPIVYVFDILL
ncbi:MAG: hypothetical protein RJB13_2517 [Pseudomonadota bacterium]